VTAYSTIKNSFKAENNNNNNNNNNNKSTTTTQNPFSEAVKK